jgi:hypothetical protein
MKLLIHSDGYVSFIPSGVTANAREGETLRDATEDELALIAQGGLLRVVDGDLTEVPLPPPDEVAAWRLHAIAALTPHGDITLADAIDGLINSLTEPDRTVIHASWHRGTVVRRDSPTVLSLAAELALEPADLDNLFRQAAAIQV